jgi:hypothetical protein
LGSWTLGLVDSWTLGLSDSLSLGFLTLRHSDSHTHGPLLGLSSFGHAFSSGAEDSLQTGTPNAVIYSLSWSPEQGTTSPDRCFTYSLFFFFFFFFFFCDPPMGRCTVVEDTMYHSATSDSL